jgi:hypothetical protein
VASESGAWWLRWRDAYPCGRWFRAVKRDDDGCIEDWEWGHKEDRTSFPTRAEAERAARTEYAGRHNWVGGWKHGIAIMRPKRRAAVLPCGALTAGGRPCTLPPGHEWHSTDDGHRWAVGSYVKTPAAPLSPVPAPGPFVYRSCGYCGALERRDGEPHVCAPTAELARWAAVPVAERVRVLKLCYEALDVGPLPGANERREASFAALALLRTAAGASR